MFDRFWIRVRGPVLATGPSSEVARRFERLPVSFEDLCEQLQTLPRMFLELDGSFVWTGTSDVSDEEGGRSWQLDGMIYDDGERVIYVELKGTCLNDQWRQLLNAFQSDPEGLSIELVDSGSVLIGSDFEQRFNSAR